VSIFQTRCDLADATINSDYRRTRPRDD